MDVLTDRYQFDMVDVYDRVTGRNDERKTLETRVAELGVEDATHRVTGVAGDFEMREEVLASCEPDSLWFLQGGAIRG